MQDFFVKMLEEQYGQEITRKILNGLKNNRYTTFRANTLKCNINEIEKILHQEKLEYEKIEWYKDAFILKNADEQKIRKLSIYNEGKIYLQSLSSMLPPVILNPVQGDDILDMTAAPGGKTTQIATMTNNKANITAIEMNKIRVERLKYNINKQGANVYTINADARKLDDFFSFDKILLDAPCSGSGTLNINKINENFNIKLINNCIFSQKSLIKKAVKVLKLGGELVYSTCSILTSENEEIVKEILNNGEMELVPIDLKIKSCVPTLPTKLDGTLCVCPNEYYEGFFVAKLRKIKNRNIL